MLKSEDHVYVEDLNLSRNKFKYLIKSGKIIARKFDFHDRYVCIFETTSDIGYYNYGDIKEILRFDNDWNREVENLFRVCFDIEKKEIKEVINKGNSNYHNGIMIIFNKNFNESHINKFWKMLDIFIIKILNNSKLYNYNQRCNEFEYYYKKNIVKNKKKREIENDSNFETSISKKIKKEETLNYGPPSGNRPPPLQNVTYQSSPPSLQSVTSQLSQYPLQNVTSQLSQYPLQSVISQLSPPPLQSVTSQLSIKDLVTLELFKQNSVSRDPRLKRNSLNNSFGSTSSTVSNVPHSPNECQVPQIDTSKDEFIKLKCEYDKLFKSYKQIKINAGIFKTDCEKLTQKVYNLERELIRIKAINRKKIIENETNINEITRLKTIINSTV